MSPHRQSRAAALGRPRRSIACLPLATIACCVITACGSSSIGAPGVIVANATTFENFTVGGIDQQQDWRSLGGVGARPAVDPSESHCRVYDHEITNNTTATGYSFPSLGSRSLRISNAVTFGCYADQTFSARTENTAGEVTATSRSSDGVTEWARQGSVLQNHFEAEWTFASTVPLAQQPGLEVQASPARGDEHRMSWVQMSDLADGLAVTFAERSDPTAPGEFLFTTVAHGLDRSAPHTIKVSMDFRIGPSNDVVTVSVDGVVRHTGTSWENYYFYDATGRAAFGGAPPAVNRIMFRTGSDALRGVPGTAAPATLGHGFLIDNVRVSALSVSAAR